MSDTSRPALFHGSLQGQFGDTGLRHGREGAVQLTATCIGGITGGPVTVLITNRRPSGDTV